MVSSRVKGVITPALTFFNEDFEVSSDLNELLYQHALLNGADALFLFGTTGEGLWFNDKTNQKIKLIETAKGVSKEGFPILVGIFEEDKGDILNEMELLGKKFNDISFVIKPPISKNLEPDHLKSYFETIIGSFSYSNKIYLYNNPNLFGGNIISEEILQSLIKFDNLAGIKDSYDKINNYISYIKFLNEDFGVYCGKEGNFSTFLQLVPEEKRHLCGIVPSISNLVNFSKKYYDSAVEGNTLNIVQCQDELNDFRNKIYDIQDDKGKQQRGLKFAFSFLYKELVMGKFSEYLHVAPDYAKPIEPVSQERIKATVKYLISLNYIDRYYSLGSHLYTLKKFKEIYAQINEIIDLGGFNRIKGPYEGKINTLYRFKIDHKDAVLRARTSNVFQYEDIIKEKILYPFLDGTLSMETENLGEKVKEIGLSRTGTYIFDSEYPPIISVCDLYYYDESKEVMPYIYTLQKYLKGKPLFNILENYLKLETNFDMVKFQNLFSNLGKILAKMHTITFDSFYEKVYEIGKDSAKKSWKDLFEIEVNTQLSLAKKNKIQYVDEISSYFKKYESLIEEETEAVLFHNDFQSQNIIAKENQGIIRIKGLIDFDNWRIGVRQQDFVKIDYWTLKPLNAPYLKDSFLDGYQKFSNIRINNDFLKKIEIYKLLWLLKVYNFEIEKGKESEKNKYVDMRFPKTQEYLEDIRKIVENDN